MARDNPGGYPATLTYQQAAVVQPFANTLVNMQLTGRQIQAAARAAVAADAGAARPPFLRLGISEGLQLHLRPAGPGREARSPTMWLNGELDPADDRSTR